MASRSPQPRKVVEIARPGVVAGGSVLWKPIACAEHYWEGENCDCPPGPQTFAWTRGEYEILYGGGRGGGKAVDSKGLIVTPKGLVPIGTLQVGDMVTDPTTGGTCEVLGVYPQGEQEIYRVVCDDGATAYVTLDHLWAYKLPNHIRPRTKPSSEREYSIQELGATVPDERWNNLRLGRTSDLVEALSKGFNPRIPLTEPVIFTMNGRTGSGAVEPYLAGLLLGDGHIESLVIASADDEIREYLQAKGFVPSGQRLHTDGKPIAWRPTETIRKPLRMWAINHELNDKHAWDKFVPEYVFTSSIEYRLEFIRGLMDTDGYVDDRGRCYFTSTSKALAEGVRRIIWSLGGKVSIREKQTSYTYLGGTYDGRLAYEIRIWLRKTSALFKLSRKKGRCTDSWNGGHELMREIVSIELVDRRDAVCIKVNSPYGLFATDDFIVTHNTELGRAWLMKGNPEEPQSHTSKCLAVQGRGDCDCGAAVNGSYLNHSRYRALVLRKNQTDLHDWLDRARSLYGPLGGKFVDRPPTIEFPSGAKIIVGHMADGDAYEKYMGQEFHRMVLEELTQIPDELLYLRIRASCRSTFVCAKGCPPGTCRCGALRRQIFITANPGGPGSSWVKARFVNIKRDDGSLVRPFEPYTDVEGLSRIYIPARLSDNPFLMRDPGYRASLVQLPEAQRRAWLEGDWDALSGQFFTQFRIKPLGGEPPEARHVVDPGEIQLQPWWPRTIGMDWGYRHATAVYWGCFLPSGQIVVYRERIFQGADPDYIGAEIARESARELAESGRPMTLWISPETIGHHKDERTVGYQVQLGLRRVLGPDAARIFEPEDLGMDDDDKLSAREAVARWQRGAAIVLRRARNQRVDGWQWMHSLMRFTPLAKPDLTRFDPKYAQELLLHHGSREYFSYIDSFKPKDQEVLPRLLVTNACPKLIDAIPSAVHDEGTEDVLKTDLASDDALDACFVAGTLISTSTGDRAIESVQAGELVHTRVGLRRVMATGLTRYGAETLVVTLSNGKTLQGTSTHPVWVKGKGWIALGTLQQGDVVDTPKRPGLFGRITTWARGFVPVRVVSVAGGDRRDVFNLSVEGQPEFYANGVLVHNCRYLLMGMKWEAEKLPLREFVAQRLAEVERTSPGVTQTSGKFWVEDFAKREWDSQQVQDGANVHRSSRARRFAKVN